MNIENKIKSKICLNEILQSTLISKMPQAITFVNPFSYYPLQGRPDLIEKIDYFFIDGVLLQVLHNFFYKSNIERASFDFSSIAHQVLTFASSNSLKVAFIGSSKEEIRKAHINFKKIYSKLNIVSFRNGFFQGIELDLYLNELKKIRPDILIVGTGTPFQEEIILKAKDMGVSSLMLTCGGFITQTSIKPNYYYNFINKLNLRWLQRAILHSHVRKRLLIDYPRFLIKYCLQNIVRSR